MKKNQDYIVTIEDLSVEGEGIGKISEGELGNENGFPLFIKGPCHQGQKELWLWTPDGNHHAIAKSCKAAVSCRTSVRRLHASMYDL